MRRSRRPGLAGASAALALACLLGAGRAERRRHPVAPSPGEPVGGAADPPGQEPGPRPARHRGRGPDLQVEPRPAIKGFAHLQRCAEGAIRRRVRVPARSTASRRVWRFELVVAGTGGRVVRTRLVVQSGTRRSVGGSPTTSPTTSTGAPAKSPTTTTTLASKGAPSKGGSAAPKWWAPGTGPIEWQWELAHPLDLSSASDLGEGATTYSGAASPDPSVYDIDGIANPAATVAGLHARGAHVLCYLEVGSAGDYYGADDGGSSYYGELQAAGDLGAEVGGSGDYYLNIDAASTVAIVEKMIRDQCAAKGFDAVAPAVDDSWYDSTGFSITMADELAYLTTLDDYAHSLGLGWGFSDGDEDSSPSGSTAFLDAVVADHLADFDLDEQCFAYNTCSMISPLFHAAGIAVFEVEYSDAGAPDQSALLPLGGRRGDERRAVRHEPRRDRPGPCG